MIDNRVDSFGNQSKSEVADSDITPRWSVCYDSLGGKTTVITKLKLSDIKDTVSRARAEGNSTPVHVGIKAWMLKHVVASVNMDDVDFKPSAEKIVITDNSIKTTAV
ncbi:MAG TPA: hypothetical protein VI911_00555 [Patescibacteria group bacterium]|nr:hypothetical protein [Patescibacteria group bacterium]